MSRGALATSLGCALLFTAFAAGATPAPADCSGVGESATLHTCQHASFGPFANVAAQSYPGFVYTDVNTPHTHFTVTLSGSPGQNRSAVLYQPASTGAFAFYQETSLLAAVVDENDTEVPLRLEHAISECPDPGTLTWVRVYDLEETHAYRLVFGPTENSSAVIVAEYLQAFSDTLYADVDGDGVGSTGAALSSWCGARPGYVRVGGDCDDASANIHPGAFDACNGVDDDCNGTPDDAPGICAGSVDGVMCLPDTPGASCGCDGDEDCAEGGTCEAGAHRCVAGDPGGAGDAGDADARTDGGCALSPWTGAKSAHIHAALLSIAALVGAARSSRRARARRDMRRRL